MAGALQNEADALHQEYLAASAAGDTERANTLRRQGRALDQESRVGPLREHAMGNIEVGDVYEDEETGRFATVRSGSIEDERINEGRPTLIPFQWDGEILDQEKATERALASGKQWPAYRSNEEATRDSRYLSASMSAPSPEDPSKKDLEAEAFRTMEALQAARAEGDTLWADQLMNYGRSLDHYRDTGGGHLPPSPLGDKSVFVQPMPEGAGFEVAGPIKAGLQRTAGGMLRATADVAQLTLRPATSYLKPDQLKIVMQRATAGLGYVDPEVYAREVMTAEQEAYMLNDRAELTAALTGTASELDKRREKSNVYSKKDIFHSPEAFVAHSIEGTAGMATALGLGFIGRKKASGARSNTGRLLSQSALSADVYGNAIEEGKQLGLTDREARRRGVFMIATEFIPETLAMDQIFRKGGRGLMPFVKSMLIAGGAEGAQEMLTEIMQYAYDQNLFDKEMTWGELWPKMVRAGALGATIGMTLRGVPAAVDAMQPDKPVMPPKADVEDRKGRPAVDPENPIDPTDPPPPPPSDDVDTPGGTPEEMKAWRERENQRILQSIEGESSPETDAPDEGPSLADEWGDDHTTMSMVVEELEALQAGDPLKPDMQEALVELGYVRVNDVGRAAMLPKGRRALGDIQKRLSEVKAGDWTGVDRRRDAKRRARVEAMTPEERQQEIYQSGKGGLANWRALQEDIKSEDPPIIVAIDVDSLGWVNKQMGSPRGDELLDAVGLALADKDISAYHKSGDEFFVTGYEREEIETALQEVAAELETTEISDGETTMNPTITWDYGRNIDSADAAMQDRKRERVDIGLRSGSAEIAPPSARSMVPTEEGGGWRAWEPPAKVMPEVLEPGISPELEGDERIQDAEMRANLEGKAKELSTVAPADSKKVNPQSDTLFQAMAKLGGLSREVAETEGFDVADMKVQKREGTSRVFPAENAKHGSIDSLREELVEEGYLPEDATVNDLLNKIEAQIRGEDQYAPSVDFASITPEWFGDESGRLTPRAGQKAIERALAGEHLGSREATFIKDVMDEITRTKTEDAYGQQALDDTPNAFVDLQGGIADDPNLTSDEAADKAFGAVKTIHDALTEGVAVEEIEEAIDAAAVEITEPAEGATEEGADTGPSAQEEGDDAGRPEGAKTGELTDVFQETKARMQAALEGLSMNQLQEVLRKSGLRASANDDVQRRVDRAITAREASDVLNQFDTEVEIYEAVDSGAISKEQLWEWHKATRKGSAAENSPENTHQNLAKVLSWATTWKAIKIKRPKGALPLYLQTKRTGGLEITTQMREVMRLRDELIDESADAPEEQGGRFLEQFRKELGESGLAEMQVDLSRGLRPADVLADYYQISPEEWSTLRFDSDAAPLEYGAIAVEVFQEEIENRVGRDIELDETALAAVETDIKKQRAEGVNSMTAAIVAYRNAGAITTEEAQILREFTPTEGIPETEDEFLARRKEELKEVSVDDEQAELDFQAITLGMLDAQSDLPMTPEAPEGYDPRSFVLLYREGYEKAKALGEEPADKVPMGLEVSRKYPDLVAMSEPEIADSMNAKELGALVLAIGGPRGTKPENALFLRRLYDQVRSIDALNLEALDDPTTATKAERDDLRDMKTSIRQGSMRRFKPGHPNIYKPGRSLEEWRDSLIKWRAKMISFIEADEGPLESVDRFRRPDARQISARLPWTPLKGPISAVARFLNVGIDAARTDMRAMAKNVKVVNRYLGIRSERNATPEEGAQNFIDHVAGNLTWLYNQVPAEIRDRSQKWYEGANRIAKRFARQYGVSETTAAAVLAAVSPQNDWGNNVAMAERILSIWTTQQDTVADTAVQGMLDQNLPTQQQGWHLERLKTLPLKELAPFEQAMWVRSYSEAYHNPGFFMPTPEGNFAPSLSIAEPDGLAMGTMRWKSFKSIAKALQILDDPRVDTISAVVGKAQKVRSFYNNIINPNGAGQDVTIDTHAVAAALLRPLGQANIEVQQNFGDAKGSADSGPTGLKGAYWLYAEGYRQAARELGLQPRELQSIVWEASRAMFANKHPQAQRRADGIWKRYENGTIEADKAREMILAASGDPGRSDLGGLEATGTTSYQGELPRSGVGRRAGGTGARGRSGAARRTALESLDDPGLRGWHGSGSIYSAVDIAAVGSGEGNIAYGWGYYATTSKGIGGHYRHQTSQPGARIQVGDVSIDIGSDATFDQRQTNLDTLQAALKDQGIEASETAVAWYAVIVESARGVRIDVGTRIRNLLNTQQGHKRRAEGDQATQIEMLPTSDRILGGQTRLEAIDQAIVDLTQMLVINDNTTTESPGRLYEVGFDLSPDQIMNWDIPLENQPEILAKIPADFRSDLEDWLGDETNEVPDLAVYTGRELYSVIKRSIDYQYIGEALPAVQAKFDEIEARAQQFGGLNPRWETDMLASLLLSSFDIQGHRYLGHGTQAENFVIYDDASIRILGFSSKELDIIEGRDSPGQTVEDVEALVSELTENWADDAPNVTVVQSGTDLPVARGQQAQDRTFTSGMIVGDQIYLVADRMFDDAKVRSVLMHEAVGHAMMMRRGDFDQIIADIIGNTSDSIIATVRAAVQARYNVPGRKPLSPQREAAEILAVLAERNPTLPLVKRAITAVRKLLRSLGFDLTFTDADIVGALHDAAKAIEDGDVRVELTKETFEVMAQDLRDIYSMHVDNVTTQKIKVPIGKAVRSTRDAALVMRELLKFAQENLVALVLDVNDKPLALLRHQMGRTDAAAIEPHILAGAILSVPGAAKFYMGHNHPSGSDEPSSADINLTVSFALYFGDGMFLDTHVEPLPHIVIGNDDPNVFSEIDPEGYVTRSRPVGKERKNKQTIEVQERIITYRDLSERDVMSSSQRVIDQWRRSETKDYGVMLLDTRNHVVAWIPLTAGEQISLRLGQEQSGKTRLLIGSHRGNANAMVPIAPMGDAGRKAMANMIAFGNAIGLRVIDGIQVSETESLSWVGAGLVGPNETYMSEDRPPDMNPEEARALEEMGKRIGSKVGPTGIRQLIASAMAVTRRELDQGIFDRFSGLKNALTDAGEDIGAYMTARFSTGLDTVMHSIMKYGPPAWKDGVTTTGGKGFLEIMDPIRGKIDDWNKYMAGTRAKRLLMEGYDDNSDVINNELAGRGRPQTKEAAFTLMLEEGPDGGFVRDMVIQAGREKNFTPEMINAAVNLGFRNPEFREVAREYAEFHKAVLDYAQEAGVIDPETRPFWEHADYVPFWRIQDDRVVGPIKAGGRGVVDQKSGVKYLKGGEMGIGNVFDNIVANMTHLVDASLKNKAAMETVDALKGTGLVRKAKYKISKAMVPGSELKKIMREAGIDPDTIDPKVTKGLRKMTSIGRPEGDNVFSILRDGQREWYETDDKLLFRAISNINMRAFGKITRFMRGFKRFFTQTITLAPDFIIRNFERDLLSSFVISRDHYEPITSAMKGFGEVMRENETYRSMLSAGAAFDQGYVNFTDAASAGERVRKKAKMGKDVFILDAPGKLFEAYKKLSNAAENANRVAVYNAAIKAGRSKKQAAFEAKDLMDFSMGGDYGLIQWLIQVVPFMGARMQGIHRLARGAGENPMAFAIKGSMLMLATLALYGMNRDDERYQQLTDVQKDLYWHWWVGDDHYALPKPFEVGAFFGTLPERITERMMSQEGDANKILLKRLWFMIMETFSFNPIPQAVRPVVESGMNMNFFRSSDIVRAFEEGTLPADQYRYYTSPTMRELAQNIPEWMTRGAVGEKVGSPLHLENLYAGYTGTLGRYALQASDQLMRAYSDKYAPGPEWELENYPVIQAFYHGDQPRASGYQEPYYDLLRQITRVKGSLVKMEREEREERFDEIESEFAQVVDVFEDVAGIQKQIRALNKEMGETWIDKDMSPAKKREEINQMQREKNALFKEGYQFRPGGAENRPRQPKKDDYQKLLLEFGAADLPAEIQDRAPATADMVREILDQRVMGLARR